MVDDKHVASLDDIAEFAASLPDGFVQCRELMHNWTAYNVRDGENGGFERVLRCNRCHSRRVQLLTSYGSVVSDKREYTEGYLSAGRGRITGAGRDVMRLESLTRTKQRKSGQPAPKRKGK